MVVLPKIIKLDDFSINSSDNEPEYECSPVKIQLPREKKAKEIIFEPEEVCKANDNRANKYVFPLLISVKRNSVNETSNRRSKIESHSPLDNSHENRSFMKNPTYNKPEDIGIDFAELTLTPFGKKTIELNNEIKKIVEGNPMLVFKRTAMASYERSPRQKCTTPLKLKEVLLNTHKKGEKDLARPMSKEKIKPSSGVTRFFKKTLLYDTNISDGELNLLFNRAIKKHDSKAKRSIVQSLCGSEKRKRILNIQEPTNGPIEKKLFENPADCYDTINSKTTIERDALHNKTEEIRPTYTPVRPYTHQLNTVSCEKNLPIPIQNKVHEVSIVL